MFIRYFYAHITHVTWVQMLMRGRGGRDRMVAEFTTTCAISVYHH